uniref:MAM domain-containing protein n=1 Tax=Wuchereria bancrofti TaxID=6293 RepID=A0A1I8ELT7_WUCBA
MKCKRDGIVFKSVMISINKAEIRKANLSCNFDDDGLYAYAKGGRAVLAEGHLISTEVEEYDEHQATLSFTYWKSNSISKLDVCIAQQNAFICTYTAPDLIDKELRWIKQEIILPNNLSTPFKIVFRARNIYTPTDIVAIDEIEYNNNSPKAFASLKRFHPTNKQFLIHVFLFNAHLLIHPVHGNIAMDSEGEGIAKSDFFMVPPEAFVEMDVWMSENALLTILENMENNLMVWNRKGLYNGDGWYRLRIPMKTSKQPVQLLLKGTVPTNNFITISNIKLVNNDGNEISCDVSALNFIKPQFNNTERLTAFQQLHTNQIKPTTIILKDRENESVRSLINNIIPTQNFYRRTSFTAPMINSNSNLASNSKFKEIRKLQLTNNKIGEFLKDQSGLSSRIINDPIKQQQQQQQHKLNLTLPILPFQRHDGLTSEFVTFTQPLPEKSYAESDFSLGPIINQYKRSNSSAKHSIMKELNSLLSQTNGQSVLGMQLRQLAQRFGFTGMNAEQSLELLKNFMNLKGLQSKIADGDDQEENKKPEPIRPINAPSHFISKKFFGESKNLFG